MLLSYKLLPTSNPMLLSDKLLPTSNPMLLSDKLLPTSNPKLLSDKLLPTSNPKLLPYKLLPNLNASPSPSGIVNRGQQAASRAVAMRCSAAKKNGKTTCRDLPSADKCKDDSGKVCTKKTGHTCAVIKTLNLPVSNDNGCTIGEEVVCDDPTKNTLNLQECGKVEQTCKYVNGKATCSDIAPKLCRSETGKQCTKLTWTVCGPGTSEESEVIIGGE